jgi:mannose-6-phosphate isomerase-like protein (cupin superfamily)
MSTLSPSLGSLTSGRSGAVARANGTGPATWAMGALFERLVGAGDTAGVLAASIVTQPPGSGSPLHVHTREAEAWYLLEGTMTYVAGTETFHLAPGDFIYLPQDVPHAFRTTGATPARFLGLSLPGRLMDLYDEVGEPAAERRLPDGGVTAGDIARWNELAPTYGVRVVGPPIAPHQSPARE